MTKSPRKIYIAAPLFCESERWFNEKIDAILRSLGHETYLPQRDGGCYAELPELIDGRPKEQVLYEKDIAALNWCDTLLFLPDGFPMRGPALSWAMPPLRGRTWWPIKPTLGPL